VRTLVYIFILSLSLLVSACNGSRKYFKAAEKLEKQGLVQEAAEYYLEALQRKATNVDARIKLREIGQKHISNLSSEFFRNFNTQQTEASMATFERLKEFNSRCTALNVQLDYPKSYDEDYQKCVDEFLQKNYNQAYLMVNQKKYYDAIGYINKIDKYNPAYKNTRQLEIVAVCEPLYQSAITNLEAKNYGSALQLLSQIKAKSETYKDLPDLLELASAQGTKSFILFTPSPANVDLDRQIQTYLFDNFSEVAQRDFKTAVVLNNTPFQAAPNSADFNTGANVDLVEAIRKASGADYFYFFDILNRKEYNSGINKVGGRGYEEVVTRINDTTTRTEYRPFDYNIVKSSRSFSYDYRYKLVNAYTNQVVASQTQNIKAGDAVEYNEFARRFTGNINTVFPYNPQQVAPIARYSPKNFRNGFTARSDLKSIEDLKTDVLNQTVRFFSNASALMK
jgi:tetratricopeptide (TPR) repeat protein